MIILLLASSAAAFTSFGIRRAMQSGNVAAFVSQSVPDTMTAGETYTVTVTMRNQGATTWTEANHYRLGSQNPQDNGTWRDGRVYLEAGESVAPGALKTFSFQIVAPSSPGSYNFQWRMVRDGVEWFGATTQNLPVQVVPRPVSTKLKEYVYAGGRLIASEEKSCVPTLNPQTASQPVGGGTGFFDVSISECNWNATSSAGWITINGPSSGEGAGRVNYSVAANSGPQRAGTITVNGQAFTIIQNPNPSTCAYSLNDSEESFSDQAGSRSVNLMTDGGCAWTAVSNATSWLTVTSPADGSGVDSGPIGYSVTPNNSGAQRTGLITVNGQHLTVTQAPNQASCSFALNPSSWLYPIGGGGGLFTVTTGAGCQWDAANPNGWILITGGATNPHGGGSGPVSFNVQANNDGSRTGSINVKGQLFTVTQCGQALSPTSEYYGQYGGGGLITVSSAAGCSWSAVTNDWDWLHIVSGANGSGNGGVGYSVDSYNQYNGYRQGAIMVTGQTAYIDQFGPVCSLSCEYPYRLEETTCECVCEYCETIAGASKPAPDAKLTGLTAGYFDNTTMSGQPALKRTDHVVNFNWDGNQPAKILPASGFSARWSGQFAAPADETYTFYLFSDGGARLWVNNQLVIDRWQPPFERQTRSAPIELKAAERADIRVDYYNAGEKAEIRLLWSSHSTPKQIIPQRYLFPEGVTDNPTPTDTNKQTGMLLPPRFGAGPKALISGLASPLVRVVLALSIAACILALLLWNVMPISVRRLGGYGNYAEKAEIAWRLSLRFLSALSASAVRQAQRGVGQVARLIVLLVAPCLRLLLESLRTVARKSLSLWRSSGVARLKPVLRRALVFALIVRLATPLTQAEAEGLVLAAQTAWREVSAYADSAMKRAVKVDSGARPVKAVSMAPQTEPQVDTLQVCPGQLIMFVGERYTLTPVALDGSHQVVHRAVMNWNSLNISVAKVSSFGQVEAVAVGNTSVEVESGGASKQIPIEVRSGTRPTRSNQEADLDTGDCSEEQAAMYAPYASQAKKDASAQQNLIFADGVVSDEDPAPLTNSRAAYFRNAVGNPRFTPKSRGSAAVPTSTQLGSYNYQFNVPVVSVGGRGASASIGMTFNSRVWNVDDGKLSFNYVGAYPAPGWSMGYGKIIRNYNATATGDGSGIGSGNSPGDYLLVTGDGTRIRLAARYVATQDRWLHESDDGSFLQFDPRSGEMRYPDGSRMVYSSVNGCLLPTAIINSNGGVITMTYRDYCEGNCVQVFRHRTALSAVRDTLGRYVTFHYYGDVGLEYQADPNNGKPAGELAAIKAPDKDGVQQDVIKVEYQPITLRYNFGSLLVDAPANGSQIQVVRRIHYPQTGKGFLFQDYSSYGLPRKISSRERMKGAGGQVTDGTEVAYTTYNYTTIATDPNDPPYNRNQVGSLNDFPQFTQREEWWLDKTTDTGAPTTDTTKYIYGRTTNATTEESTVEYVGKNVTEVMTTGIDSSHLNFGKVISVELRKIQPATVLSKQVFTYMTGTAGEVEIEKIETFDEAGQGTQVSFSHGPYGRVINKYEYGYKQGSDYQVRRRTQYEYEDHPNYIDEQGLRESRFLRLVKSVSIFDGSGAPMAKTVVEYDNYAAMGQMESYGLSKNTYPPNHDDKYNDGYVFRGNPTAVTTFSKFSPNEESTTRRMRYDIFGNVVEAQLSCCVVKSFGFSHLTYYSQPDWVRSGPDSTTELNLKTDYSYNNFTGQVTEEMNPDGLRTIYEYDRALRLKRATSPTGAEMETKFQDSNGNDLLVYSSLTRYDDQGTTKVITGKQWFDGARRVIRAGTGTGEAPDSYDMTATVYDGWGRVTKQSNPYPGDADGNGGSQFWTVNAYDELSRVKTVTLPGNGNQTVQTDYNGAVTTVTDTVGRKRRSEVDGLGRLVKVIEQNPANGNLEWETSYSYDVLNNLTQTNQGGQVRTFEYDAKSRLTREKTPEAGQVDYTYTNFDAVSIRTDARGVITRYTYGELNLLNRVEYDTASAPGVAATKNVTIEYKTGGPGKAKIKKVMYADGTWSESYDYDSFGRLQSRTRDIDSIKYETRYEYNEAGQMAQMIYPSGKRVKVGHDARGRLAELKKVDDSGNPQEPSYLSGVVYRADGLISRQDLGDGTIEEFGYSDDRLQLTLQKVKKGENTLLSLSYGYDAVAGKMGSGTTAGNSGQVVSVTGTINGQTRDQAFTYDNVGRLVTATGWGAWARRYEYDQYGNQTKVWDAVSGGSTLQNTSIAKNASNVETNRIASVNGTAFYYSANGNLTDDAVREYTYDAKNRIVDVRVKVSGLIESYGYDAANHRVKKVVGGVVTHYIWEGNKVIAEYERGGGNTPATGTRYYHQDRLSTRLLTDGSGVVRGTTDHLPFGEEIGLSDEGEKHKFTTYERDVTGLDYAVNRHFSPTQGRFAQADPLGMGAVRLGDPQSLNLYSYVRNDPVNAVDPTGTDMIAITSCVTQKMGGIVIGVDCETTYYITGGGPVSVGGGGGGGNSGGGGGGGGQSWPEVPLPDRNTLNKEMDKLLSKSDCAEFVKKLINKLAALTQNPAISDNAKALFGMIRDIKTVSTLDPTTGGEVRGSISSKDADILLKPLRHQDLNSPVVGTILYQRYAQSMLHETIHHAGSKGYYYDTDVARAVGELGGLTSDEQTKFGAIKFNGSDEDNMNLNLFWDAVLRRHCPDR